MTSKTKLFCKTSSVFQVDNIKNEGILRDFLQTWKVECRAHGLVPMRFPIFALHLSKVLSLPRKSDAKSYEVLHLSRNIISVNLKIWCSKMQPISGNQRPDFRTALMNMSLALRLPRVRHLVDPLRMSHACHRFRKCYKTLTFCSLLTRCIIPCACHAKTASERPKVLRTRQFFTLLTSTCASRRNGAYFYDISTSKKMCVAAQQRALFSTSQLLKVVRSWGVLYILTLKCALHHNSVHFFDITTSKSEDQKWSEVVLSCTFWLWNAHPPL